MDKTLTEVDTFITYTLEILVFFVGMHLNQRFKFLREYNIPDAVTGGIIASSLSLALCP